MRGGNYLNFVADVVIPMLDDMTLQSRHLWYELDGAPAHFTHPVRQKWLNHHFQGRWIGRAGPVACPAKSPDLIPLDFFLWGFMKEKA